MIQIVKKIRGNIGHAFLPSLLVLLSKFNEKYYLSQDHSSLVPLYLVRILLFFFGVWLSISIGNLIVKYTQAKDKANKIILSEKQKAFFLIFSWFLVWYGFWLIIYYPGSYTTDTMDAIWQFRHMNINDWFSYLHPLLYLFLFQLYPKIVVIGIAQVLLCSVVYAEIISYFYSKFCLRKKWKVFIFVLFIILFSSTVSITSYSFFYMRDIPYGVLHLYLAFYLFKVCIEGGKNKIKKKQLATLLSLSLILSIYRGEGWIVLTVVLFSLLLYGKFTIKSFFKISILSLILFYVLSSLLPQFLNVYSARKNQYNLTLVAYPLGFILKEKNNYISSNYEQDKEILSKVVDIEAIQKYTNSYDIEDFQHAREGIQHWNIEATDEEWEQFYKRTFKIFRENPHLFMAARTANFVSQLFVFENRGERMNDSGRTMLTYDACKKDKYNGWCLHFHEGSRLRTLLEIPTCHGNYGVCGYIPLMKLNSMSMEWHWNSAIALLLSILVLCLYKYLPISAMSSAVILCRMPLVFLTAPCVFLRYVFSLYLYGFFILFFVLLELRDKNLHLDIGKRKAPVRENN